MAQNTRARIPKMLPTRETHDETFVFSDFILGTCAYGDQILFGSNPKKREFIRDVSSNIQ